MIRPVSPHSNPNQKIAIFSLAIGVVSTVALFILAAQGGGFDISHIVQGEVFPLTVLATTSYLVAMISAVRARCNPLKPPAYTQLRGHAPFATKGRSARAPSEHGAPRGLEAKEEKKEVEEVREVKQEALSEEVRAEISAQKEKLEKMLPEFHHAMAHLCLAMLAKCNKGKVKPADYKTIMAFFADGLSNALFMMRVMEKYARESFLAMSPSRALFKKTQVRQEDPQLEADLAVPNLLASLIKVLEGVPQEGLPSAPFLTAESRVTLHGHALDRRLVTAYNLKNFEEVAALLDGKPIVERSHYGHFLKLVAMLMLPANQKLLEQEEIYLSFAHLGKLAHIFTNRSAHPEKFGEEEAAAYDQLLDAEVTHNIHNRDNQVAFLCDHEALGDLKKRILEKFHLTEADARNLTEQDPRKVYHVRDCPFAPYNLRSQLPPKDWVNPMNDKTSDVPALVRLKIGGNPMRVVDSVMMTFAGIRVVRWWLVGKAVNHLKGDFFNYFKANATVHQMVQTMFEPIWKMVEPGHTYRNELLAIFRKTIPQLQKAFLEEAAKNKARPDFPAVLGILQKYVETLTHDVFPELQKLVETLDKTDKKQQ